MSILNIIEYPHPNLRKKSIEVQSFDGELATLAEDMLATMYESNGIGLAAPQVNIQKRLIVVDVSEERNQPQVLVNPVVQSSCGKRKYSEGCLSIPGFSEMVERADEITVAYQDVKGNQMSLTTNGLLATCIQHEIDHLEGKLFIDNLSQLKRSRIISKIEKNNQNIKRNLKSKV